MRPFLYMKNNEKKGQRKRIKPVFAFLLTVGIACLLLLASGATTIGVIALTTDSREDMRVMEMMRGSRTTRLYAPKENSSREGLTIENYVPVEVDILHGDENMVWANSDEIPDILREAFISIEDRRFYEHRGVEWGRTFYAALNQIFRFRPRFGGSTITQQLIKNVHEDRDISVFRKVKEIIRALRLEKAYTKDEILTYYLNIVPLGHGCVGVKSAARYYFDKAPSELTTVECASLAAITNAPVKYDPVSRSENNAHRRGLVLQAMHASGYISDAAYRRAINTELQLNITDPIYTDHPHNWYVETVISDVMHDLMEQYGMSEGTAKGLLYHGGLEIYTLMDTKVQKIMDDCFADAERFKGERGCKIEAGMTICDPYSGDLLGVIGGVGKKEGSRLFNRATDGYYQPGSVLKPLALYGPAVEWNKIHYATAFDDLPQPRDGGYWPHNSPEVYVGRITTHEALAKSKNTVAVALLDLLGKKEVYQHLKTTIGLTGLTDNKEVTDIADAPLALGQLSYGTTVREMTEAYASFAAGGEIRKSRSYLAVYDSKGEPLLKQKQQAKRVWGEDTAYIMTQMMKEVVEWGTAHRITLKEMVDTAGKTGTSGQDRDKWFIGYTPYYVAGIHLAYDDRTPLTASERRHLSMWDEVMQRVHAEVLEDEGTPRSFEMPDSVVQREYCRDSGCIPTEACHGDMRGDRMAVGYFKRDYIPGTPCDLHVEAHYDTVADRYEEGIGDAPTDVNFYILSLPKRKVIEKIIPQDSPYTLEYLKTLKKEDENPEIMPPDIDDGMFVDVLFKRSKKM